MEFVKIGKSYLKHFRIKKKAKYLRLNKLSDQYKIGTEQEQEIRLF